MAAPLLSQTTEPVGARAAIAAGLPLALAVCVYGGVFGVLARNAGMSVGELAMMDALVFAGASQFVAVGYWANDAVVMLPLAVGTLAVNLRYIFITASLRDVLGRWRWPFRGLAVHFVTDENWALTMALPAPRRTARFLLVGGVMLYVGWNIGGAAGYFIGGSIVDPKLIGLDFAFTAAFVALALSMWKSASEDMLPWAAAAFVACLAARFLPANWHAITGTLAGIAALLAQRAKRG